MSVSSLPAELRDVLHQVVSYLNFSNGSSNPTTLAAWNRLYAEVTAGRPLSGLPAWLPIRHWLEDAVTELETASEPPRDYSQSRRLLQLIFSDGLPSYLDRHRDLLFHQPPEQIFNGFFLGRLAEAVLATLSEAIDRGDAGSAPADDQAVIDAAFERLDDYVGYRPLPLLDKAPGTPYPGEWVRPVPLYVAGAGVTAGPYQAIIQHAADALRSTDPSILRAASFEWDQLSELALDPRAYDFDHPVHRRPNYIFGHWDPDQVNEAGYYQRFVIRQVTLDALLQRVADEASAQMPAEQLIEEAASVLAGIILMGSGISGWGPAAHGSDVTLHSLMDPIATYRDEFYHDRINALPEPHRQRLQEEMRLRRQPFGAARQLLNTTLAGLRAKQLQHVQLARVFARMGYPDQSQKQAEFVPVTSARMMCRIDCLLSGGLRSLRSGDLAAAAAVPDEVFQLLLRAIDCGACVDPWNILYFGGNFNLFPGPEHGVRDHRVDDLVQLIEQYFGYLAKVWSEAAARNDREIYQQVDQQFDTVATWWRQYAAHTVETIDTADPLDSYDSAKLVARALRLWYQDGAAAGDIGFWAQHAELFDSPRAYALVIGALLDREDFVASMALLIHWLENAPRIGLRLGGSSLPMLAVRWLVRLRNAAGIQADDFDPPASPSARGSSSHAAAASSGQSSSDPSTAEQSPTEPTSVAGGSLDVDRAWTLAKRFLDYLEANAESYWSAPQFLLGSTAVADPPPSEEQLFDAAYDEVTYHDSTDDGHDGAVFGQRSSSDEDAQDDLEGESKRLADHLLFLESLAKIWSIAADIGYARGGQLTTDEAQQRVVVLSVWAARAAQNRQGLLELLAAVRAYRVAPQGSDNDSMRLYDRRRMVRDSLLERVIGTAVEMADARRLISAVAIAAARQHRVANTEIDESLLAMDADDSAAVSMFAALLPGDREAARQRFPPMLDALRQSSLLYIPLSRGGDPSKIFRTRLRQRMLHHLLHRMPRRGLYVEACRLIEAARMMEQHNPIGRGAVTEFDGLFRIGFRSLVTSLVTSVHAWPDHRSQSHTQELISLLESLTETMLSSWLAHSQTLRLSSLELVADESDWNELKTFIRNYGDPLFTQAFLKLSNIRAILHQGVTHWLESVLQSHEAIKQTSLFEALEEGQLSMAEADRWLTLMFESILEHHAEFLDYNSTTTQSDRGDLIYMFHDFLRLRISYDRVAWNLKPVFWAHEILVRSRFEHAAGIWRRSLSERIAAKSDLFVTQLRDLQQQYAMRMPTVADRILERFIQPMTIDRMRALVGPATRDAEAGAPSPAFELLEREAELLTAHPTGVGLDMPAWLAALEEEVEMVAKREHGNDVEAMSLVTMPIEPLSREELSGQIAAARRQGRRLPYMGR